MTDTALVAPLLSGYALGLSLIAAIGAQNLFVLRQGLLRQHVLLCVLFCALADALLASAGVAGMAQALGQAPILTQWLSVGGALFLLGYGALALRRAWTGGQAMQQLQDTPTLRWPAVLTQLAAFTLLNPHVYLDTVVLLGSVGAQHPGALKWWFALGASLASLSWFGALGYGARWLQPLFARPAAWQALDCITGATMWLLAYGLLTTGQ